jgi:hypothetical protein
MLRVSVSISEAEILEKLRMQPAFASSSLKCIRSFPSRHSELLEYNVQSDGIRQTIVVKHRPVCEDRDRTSVEFGNLTKARGMLREELRRGVPEPLLILPALGILVTRKVPGTPLAQFLKRYGNRLCGPFYSAAVAENARLAGVWLKTFQEATQAEPIVFNRGCFLAEVEKRLLRLEGKGFEPQLAREILDKVSLQSTRYQGRLMPAAARHGDFIPQNILIEGDRVGIVDFEAFAERQPVYYDPSMFLGYLLLLRASAHYHAGTLDRARLAFLSAFCGRGSIDQDLFSIYSVESAVRIITDGPQLNRGWGRRGVIGVLSKRLKDMAAGSL